MKARDAVICWNPGTDQIAVGPNRGPWLWEYAYSAGACMSKTADARGMTAVAQLFIDFHTVVVRDGVSPQAAHEAFLAIDEYRQRISPDIKGAE